MKKTLLLLCCVVAFSAVKAQNILRIINNTGCDMVVQASLTDANHTTCGTLTLKAIASAGPSNIVYTIANLDAIGYQQEPSTYTLSGVITVERFRATYAPSTFCTGGAHVGPCFGSSFNTFSATCGTCTSTTPTLTYSFSGGVYILTIN